MNKAIEAFLKSVCEKVKFTKKSVYMEFVNGKEYIKTEIKGKDAHLKALKEVVKYL